MPQAAKPSPAKMRIFLEELRRFVLDETRNRRQELFQTWSKPLATRVAEGVAIEGVRLANVRQDGLIELTCERNVSRFREGDLLCLHRGDPFDIRNPTLTIEQDDETWLLCSSEGWLEWSRLHSTPDGWFLDAGYLDLSSWILEALEEAGDTFAGRERILPLLMGVAYPRMDSARYERALHHAEAHGLNWSQAEGLAQAYATDLAYLIQGPPGTGKTRVLAHLVDLLVGEGERVFVTAFTHRAVNNALNKVAELAGSVPVVKIGHPARATDLDVENYATFADSPLAESAAGYAIGATPFATRTARLGGVEFDTVIFDEASQITLPLAIMGMLPAKRYIFAGDQRQLPPVLTTRLTGGALHRSIFGLLAERGFDTLLEESYRLNTALTEWPSRNFYAGLLRSADVAANRRIVYPRPPAKLAEILDPDAPKVFWDLGHRNTTTRSQREAGAVVDLITTLLECGIRPTEIGVVVPYRRQAREIRSRLRTAVPQSELRREIVVDTVERMQGQERDVVILSLTTTNPAFAAHLAEFFFQPERLNVAVTRPRVKLIITGSRHVLRAEADDPELQAGVELLRDLLAGCTIFYDSR